MKTLLYKGYKRFLTWFGDIMLATTPPKCNAKALRAAQYRVKKGMVICRGYNYYLDSYFIPGEYSHSGIVINELGDMLHAVAEGVVLTNFLDFIIHTDRFIMLDPKFNKAELIQVVGRAKSMYIDRTEYDFLFNDDNKFYCHEFTATCLAAGGKKVNKTIKSFGVWPFRFKLDLYLADNLIDACKVLYEFNPEDDDA